MIDRPDGPGEGGGDIDGRPSEAPVTVRLATRGRGPEIVSVLIAVFVTLALVKPWSDGPGAPHPTPRVTAAPVQVPSIDPLAGLRRNCEQPVGWRVYSRERWAKLSVRSWKSLDPAHGAGGPLDSGIPVLTLPAQIDALGYCSPWTGGERPPSDALVSAWRIRSVRMFTAESTAEPIRLQAADPGWPSVLGALYGPPVNRFDSNAVETIGWPGGRYVFAIRAPAFERWWGVDVVPPLVVAPTPAIAPGGGPAGSSGPANP